MASFLSLSNELIYLVAQPLSLKDTYALLRVNRHLSWLLLPTFHKRALKFKLKDGRNVLHWAAQNGHLQLARGLLECGAKIEAEHEWINSLRVISSKSTALHYAADSGHEDLVELLLEKGAGVNTKAPMRKETALHFATQKGHEKCVELLLERGAYVDARKHENTTALQIAAQIGNEALIRLLLNYGAEIHASDDIGRQAIHYAAANAKTDVVYLLLVKEADINGGFSKDVRGDTPLYEAVRHNHEDLVEVLLAEGADISIQNELGRTALHQAAAQGLDRIARLLIECGADVNARVDSHAHDNGMTPLFFSADQGHEKTVKVLIEMGARINCKDQDGWTALRVAEQATQEGVVKLLMENGADRSKDSQ